MTSGLEGMNASTAKLVFRGAKKEEALTAFEGAGWVRINHPNEHVRLVGGEHPSSHYTNIKINAPTIHTLDNIFM